MDQDTGADHSSIGHIHPSRRVMVVMNETRPM
jgi:hypothetical protein